MDVQLNQMVGIPTYPTNVSLNPVALIIVGIIIVVYYAFFSSLGARTTSTAGKQSGNTKFLELLMWWSFFVLVVLNLWRYVFHVDLKASIKNLFSGTPEIDVEVKADTEAPPVPEIMIEKQVFHIPNNNYGYKDAKALCKAYGGRLASYKEIEDAYEDGADWCGYGWSEDQMALYPTQYNKWKHLQKIKGHEHDCGRPGINGGYIANPNVKFGANCYGYKPRITPEESKLMENSPLYPITQKEIDFDKRVRYWREKIPDILVAPFNHNNWSVM